MKVAIIKMKYSPYGGNERYSYKIIEEFARQGHEVWVITGPNEHWINGENVFHVHIPYIKINKILKIISFNSGVKKLIEKGTDGYDCILNLDSNVEVGTHVRLGGGIHKAWIRRLVKRESAIKRFLMFLDPFHRLKIKIQENMFKNESLKKIICNSKLILNELNEYYPEVAHKAVVINNGVGWKEFSEHFRYGVKNREEILRKFNLEKDCFYFLFVGSGYRRKGLEFVIRAMKLLPSYVKLLVVGKDSNERYYRDLAKSLGILERIFFYGPQKEVIPFYQVAHAFVLPSLYDPCSNATLEALAMGLFTITSASNGASEVITEKSGMVVSDPTDVSELAECMKKALYRYHPEIKKEIRETVRHLDLSFQLPKIVETCLSA